MPNIPQVRRLMANDETIGMGFNSESGLAVGTPFVFDDILVEVDPHAPGQEVFSTITIINTHEELMKSMGMSVEAQGRYGFFSAALKAQFAESTSYNSTSTFLMAKVIVQNPFKRGRDFHLTEPAELLLGPPLQKEIFTTAFGDSYVRGVQTGSRFFAVIRITSRNTPQQDELAASLQAEYNSLVAEGSFKGAFNQANASTSTHSEFSGMMYQRAGSGEETSVVIDIDEVLQRVKNFPEIVEKEPVAYEIEVATYDTLPLPLPTPEEQENFLIALHDAREKKLRYVQVKNDLEFARLPPEYFEELPPDLVLGDAIIVYTKLINAVMSHGIDLSTGRMQPPRVFDPSELVPPLVEPAPIPLKRVTPATPATIRMPDFVAVGFSNLADAMSCLQHGGGLEDCLAGTAFGGDLDGNPQPIPVSREVAEFLNLHVNGGLEINWIPGDPVGLIMSAPGPMSFSVISQFPVAGTLISSDAQVSVQILAVPE